MLKSHRCFEIFEQSIQNYHILDDVDQPLQDPYAPNSTDSLLYRKNWIDTVQWHLEDIIRNPAIDPIAALQIKRRIDKSNQDRTDIVEIVDDTIFGEMQSVKPLPDAGLNTETPGWAIDRLSILSLKIYHMQAETQRLDASAEHIGNCQRKLGILLEQKADLFLSIDELLVDIASGRKKMKLYKQMKMYNDPSLNPVLYKK